MVFHSRAATFAKLHGFHITPELGNVNCGGNTTAAITGCSTLLLHIQSGFRQRVKFYVTDLPQGHPVILGNTWLMANKVILNHASRTMMATAGPKTFQFFCPEVNSSLAGGDPPHAKQATLSFIQARRLIHNGCEPFLVTVQAVKAKDSEPSAGNPVGTKSKSILKKDGYNQASPHMAPLSSLFKIKTAA
jgi:hypothetical protein